MSEAIFENGITATPFETFMSILTVLARKEDKARLSLV